MLQVEDSAKIGWFLYSTKEMDTDVLVDKIEDLVGLKVGLQCKIINVGMKENLPGALNVEVNSRFCWEAQRQLINFLDETQKNPNHTLH
jgi:hypothetical protein